MGRLLSLLLLLATTVSAADLLPNGSFESVEPPLPTAALKGQPAPADKWVPRTWWLIPAAWDVAGYSLPDDPAKAHTGRRCLAIDDPGGGFSVRYGPIPHFDDRPWTVRFWAKGNGRLSAAAFEFFHPWTWNHLQDASFALTDQWQPYELSVAPPPECITWHLCLSGAGRYWLDDVSVEHPGLVALGLPPDHAVTPDEHTLLHLPFEEPLDEYRFFVTGQVSLSAETEGRFGRALVLGPDGYVARSASGHLRRKVGTIECWAKLLSPGRDGQHQWLVQIPGPDGFSLRKDLFTHVIFSFGSDFRMLSAAWAEGYAYAWQPGVWRHYAVCWDTDLLELFIDGKLAAWEVHPALPAAVGDELGLGPASMVFDDLRISDVVRYRVPVRTDGPRRNESFAGGKGRY
ncbi:MAG: hypothetical protein HYU66_12610 [Armatimonadetes bacterium]|nr:hypothetical protein [Armatimonadota bacterium]